MLATAFTGREVDISATDPLAEQYATLLSEANISVPVATQKADAEHLTLHFPDDHFDIVHSRNALDHAYDPLEAISQMLQFCKK
jgi:SAM-dependent methyltransferase